MCIIAVMDMLNGVSQGEVARRIGLTRQAVTYWCKVGRVPPEHVARVAEIIGLPCHVIRPDIFPAPAGESRQTPHKRRRTTNGKGHR